VPERWQIYYMKSLNIILAFIISLFLLSCEKKLSNLQIEKNALDEVFLEIVDSIYMDRRTILPPPPPRFDFKTNREDTIGYHERLKKYWSYQDSIKKDTAKIVIGVNDYAEKVGKYDKQQMLEIYKDSLFVYDKSKDLKHFKLNLSTFKNNKKFSFKYLSEFPEVRYWDFENNLLPVGAISVSRIQFNKTRTSGVLTASASCGGGKCGRGFLIVIDNKSGNWRITKIIHTWVS
jgi:hypothetical protein